VLHVRGNLLFIKTVVGSGKESMDISDILNVIFAYGGWVLGVALSFLEIKEARETGKKSDILLEEIRKLKAENVLLQIKPAEEKRTLEVTEAQYKALQGQILDIADTERYRG
jgi:hypothetical protein